MKRSNFATHTPERPHLDGGDIITGKELSKLTGVSLLTIRQLARSKMIPSPVGYDRQGVPQFDATDAELDAWVRALQTAGYNQR